MRGQLVEVTRQDLAGITMTLTDQRAEISGTIVTDNGETVPQYLFILIYPSDEKYWTPYALRMHWARAKEDGTFVIRGVQTGSYRVATLLDAEFGAWFDPAFLRRIDPSSMPLSIADNDRKVLNLPVPGRFIRWWRSVRRFHVPRSSTDVDSASRASRLEHERDAPAITGTVEEGRSQREAAWSSGAWSARTQTGTQGDPTLSSAKFDFKSSRPQRGADRAGDSNTAAARRPPTSSGSRS